MPSARNLPVRCANDGRNAGHDHVQLPGDDVDHCQTGAAIRHMNHVDFREEPEILGAQGGGSTDASRSVAQFSGLDFASPMNWATVFAAPLG